MKSLFIVFTVLCFSYSVSNSQWIEQNSGVATDLTSVSAVDANTAWISGYSGVVLRTTNSGLNWTNVTGTPIPAALNLHNIFGIDDNNALVCGSDAGGTYVFKTVNAGTTWMPVFTQADGFMNTILMGNPMIGFMYGDPVGGRWSLWGTINGGMTWDSTDFYIPQTGNEAGWNNAMFFDRYGGTVWFGTSNTRIYRTFNLLYWTAQPTTGQTSSYAIWFNNSNTGMTGGTGILMTTNGGIDWVAPGMPMPGTANVSGITGVSDNWWVTRQSTVIYYSPDNGTSWSTDYTAPNGAYRHITKSRSGSNITLWAVRTLGGISRNEIPVGIAPVSNQIPSSFKLMQNYPNPFNPTTNIRFDLPKSGFVKLVVYDEMGKVVSVLINGEMKAGSYSIGFDGSNLSSGVYFYKFYSGSFSETKKMILSK
jgi:photosystem II stability/assembly factor-like uncharacterized protein